MLELEHFPKHEIVDLKNLNEKNKIMVMKDFVEKIENQEELG